MPLAFFGMRSVGEISTESMQRQLVRNEPKTISIRVVAIAAGNRETTPTH